MIHLTAVLKGATPGVANAISSGCAVDRRATATLARGSDPVAAQSAPQFDVAEHIGKLALLRDQGALTEDEFATKKGELLARL